MQWIQKIGGDRFSLCDISHYIRSLWSNMLFRCILCIATWYSYEDLIEIWCRNNFHMITIWKYAGDYFFNSKFDIFLTNQTPFLYLEQGILVTISRNTLAKIFSFFRVSPPQR